MTETKPDILPITDPHNVPVTFVNQVAASGILNGVVNVAFATAGFTPDNKGGVDLDLVISARLRMDLLCARELHAILGKILEQALPQSNATTH